MKTRAKVGSSDWDAMAPAATRSALIASTTSRPRTSWHWQDTRCGSRRRSCQASDSVADALRFLRVDGAPHGLDVSPEL